MQVIDQINGSALFAQSAYSAAVATNDDLGRKISTTYLTAVDLSPYATETLVEETSGAITSLIPTNYYPDSNPSSFATEQWVEDKGYLTGVSIPESATWQDVSTTVQSNSAQWADGGTGDEEVNNWVYGNSGKCDESNNVIRTNSSTWNNVTAKQNTLTFRYGTSSGSITSINGSAIVDDYTYHMLNVTRNYTASMNKVLTANSSTWNQVTAKLNTTAFSTVSGTFLTAHQSLDGYATTAEVNSVSSILSGAIDYVSANVGVSSGDLSGCVKYTDATLGIGSSNTTDDLGNNKGVFAQGISNTAVLDGFAQGETNSAMNSLAQGLSNNAYSWSLAQGSENTARYASLAQGYHNSANQSSLTQGQYNNASVYSIAQGQGTSASNYSQSFGRNTIANNSGMAIGYYNKTDSAAFVIGNGAGANSRSDAFIVYHDGSVSAAGKISANGVELGAGSEFPISADEAVQYVQTNSAGIEDTITNVTTNSGAWGGSALSLSAGPGIGLSMVDGVLVISVTGGN